MNDVKINTVDIAGRQGSSASSPPPEPVQKGQENAPSSEVKPQESREKTGQSVEKQIDNNRKNVEEAVTRLNDYVQSIQRDLQFQLDEDSGKTIITVLDSRTSEVVRQIPDDVALKLARDLQQDEPLSLFNAKV